MSESNDVKIDVDPKPEPTAPVAAAPVKLELGDDGLPVLEGKSAEEVKAALDKVAKQVSFYFSDSNLPTDKFFFSLTACNPEGWVPIKTISTFKRMRDYAPYGVPFIAHAIRAEIESEGDDPLLAVSEDNENVRRQRPLEPNSTAWNRNAYVKGFGEGDEDENTQEKIEEYFQQFGKINAVRKRRGDLEGKGDKGKGKGAFKGSVFVEFAYEVDLNKFIEQGEYPKFRDEEMTVMTKDAYVKMKAKEKGIPESNITKGEEGKTRFARSGGKFNAFREMDKMKKGMRADFAKIPDSVAIVGSQATGEPAPGKTGRKRERDGDDSEHAAKSRKPEPEPFNITYKGVELACDAHTGHIVDESKVPFEEGAVVKFNAPGEGSDWKQLKQAVIDAGLATPFMAFPPGSKSGNVSKADGASVTDAEFAALAGAGITYGEQPVEFVRPSEEEQRAFWVKRANYQGEQALKARNESAAIGQRSGGGRDRHGGGGHRGHRGGGGRGGGFKRGGRGGGRGRGDRGGRDERKPKVDSSLPPTVGASQ